MSVGAFGVRPSRRHICVLALSFFLCGCLDSGLTPGQMQWKTFHRDVDAVDPDYPVAVLQDSFKMIRVYQTEPIQAYGTKISSQKKVEWGWRIVVINKSRKDLAVNVTYTLKDADGFDISSDAAYGKYVAPGETKTIQSSSSFDYENLRRVADSNWQITHTG